MRLIITAKSRSNKQLDAFMKHIIFCVVATGAVRIGPIAFKGERKIYIYSWNKHTINKLSHIRPPHKVEVVIQYED